MAEINYSAVRGHIASGKPSPVYLICGDDSYLRRSSLALLKEKYMPDVLPEFNYTEFDGSDCTVDEIAAAVETLPMMAERRMVVVKDMDAAAISAEQYRKLESFLGSVGSNESCVLIFFNISVKASAKSGDRQGAMRGLIKKAGTVINPFSDNFVIKPQNVVHIKQHKDYLKKGFTENRVEQETRVQIGEPADYPAEMAEAIRQYAKTNKAINAIWLKLMINKDEKSYLLIVDFTGDRDTVFSAIARAGSPHIHNGIPIDMVPFTDSFGKSAATGTPFYKRRKGLFGW